MKLNNNSTQHAVWQNGGFGAFLERKVFNQSSGIFSNFGAENRHFAKLLDVGGYFNDTLQQQKIQNKLWDYLTFLRRKNNQRQLI